MKDILRHVLISLGAAFVLYIFQDIIESIYILSFLKQNLITIILALLAINTTTLGIVLTKIRELIDSKKKDSFSATKKQMIISIIEQIVLVFIALVFFSILDSKLLFTNPKLALPINVGCISIFIYDLIVLYDTSKSIFIILDFNKE